MTSGSPWSVKGIDPKTREIAKDLARRSGMTLGEWLNHVIHEDDANTPEGAASVRAAGANPDRPASENRTPRRNGDDLSQVLAVLEDLSSRFEASVNEQAETASRFEAAIAEIKSDQVKVAERLQGVEQAGPGVPGAGGGATKAETLRALEGALGKLATHFANGEQRHRDSMVEMRKEMGAELTRVAEQVNLKVAEVENRGADAIAQVGAEVSRVATAVELRLRRADDAQAEALERLGGEIARITERLSDRIATAERRAAQSVEDVGEQVARVTDRIHARQERTEADLAQRMRQSEERTAKLLEEARQTIERRLGRPVGDAGEAPLAANAAEELWTPSEPEAADLAAEAKDEGPGFLEPPAIAPDVEAIEDQDVSAETILDAEGLDDLLAAEDEPLAPPTPKGGTIPFQAYTPTLTADAAFTASEDLEAMEAVAQAITKADEAEDDESMFTPVRTEARSFQSDAAREDRIDSDELLRPSTQDLLTQAKAAAYAEHPPFAPAAVDEDEAETPFVSPFAEPRQGRARPNHAMRGVLLGGLGVASIGLAATGYVALHPEIAHLGAGTNPAKPIPVGPASSPQPAGAPQAAVALATAPTPKDSVTDLDAMYRDAAAKVDANDPTGVAPLRTAANLGYAPAQRRLGKLYEDGGAGVEKDPAEARRWTVRAAGNGDARAMHNLGLDYYQGIGGPRNYPVAAQWFQQAAELGLRDSQYNLARLMEEGVGVPRDPQGAYRWYLVAARAGDTEAQSRGEALKAKLTPDQVSRAQALASAFRADPAAGPASLTALLKGNSAKQLGLAQRALSKLGYYKGPDDGVASQALGEAIQAYQRERGLAANGQLSPELVQTFAHIAQ